MKTAFRRPAARSFLPGYGQNAVLQLIVATGVCFVVYFFIAVCLQAFAHYRYEEAVATLMPYVALPPAAGFFPKAWTLLTNGFFHVQFWGWVSNAIWLYCWGGVVQMLTGYRQVIPIFVYGALAGAIACLLVQLIPGVPGGYIVGAQAGVMALAAAAFTLSPDFRFWLGPNFSLSIKLVAGIYAALSLVGVGLNAVGLAWLAGGALAGFGYVRLLRRGYRPGEWVYDGLDGASKQLTPRDRKPAAVRRGPVLQRREAPKAKAPLSVQARVDALLEKIHQQGYDSLTREEKDFLTRTAQGND